LFRTVTLLHELLYGVPQGNCPTLAFVPKNVNRSFARAHCLRPLSKKSSHHSLQYRYHHYSYTFQLAKMATEKDKQYKYRQEIQQVGAKASGLLSSSSFIGTPYSRGRIFLQCVWEQSWGS
jgi:hypothetical protein